MPLGNDVFAISNSENEVKAPYTTIPPVDGTEDIVSYDYVWRYSVSQPINFGVMLSIATLILVCPIRKGYLENI